MQSWRWVHTTCSWPFLRDMKTCSIFTQTNPALGDSYSLDSPLHRNAIHNHQKLRERERERWKERWEKRSPREHSRNDGTSIWQNETFTHKQDTQGSFFSLNLMYCTQRNVAALLHNLESCLLTATYIFRIITFKELHKWLIWNTEHQELNVQNLPLVSIQLSISMLLS